jgi:beta-lactamase class D
MWMHSETDLGVPFVEWPVVKWPARRLERRLERLLARRVIRWLSRAALLVMLSLIASCSTEQQVVQREGLETKPAPIVKPLNDAQRVASGFAGGVFLLDGESGDVFATNEQWLVRAAIPASTFKVFSSLAALESGVVASTGQIIRLPRYTSTREEINRDLDFASAFALSALPHYQHLVREIGAVRMQSYLDNAGYGNRSMGGGVDQFWISGELRITPLEQLEFLQRLYRSDLPFRQEVMAQVKQIMQRDEYGGRVYGKTGWATAAEGLHTGWSVGWLEREAKEPLYFATLLQTTTPGDGFLTARLALSLEALAQAEPTLASVDAR